MACCSPILRISANACRSSRAFLISAIWLRHVPILSVAAQEIGVDTILSWTQDVIVAPDAPRTGRELQVFHVASAFLQEASVNAADCDVHFENPMTADKSAPRVIEVHIAIGGIDTRF